ncbi:MAG: TRAP transporter substrate-binding protein DctP [Alphaproteobacteria bacterium]|nr:TRAP transporter substrate-binding protein DctP [Alphaproteobacteria bacterium]MBU0796127.1 TRAP transporter substrate-binding protein DctP [Alphaproteobacteria bacterium]MBU0888498.1 TRAP transporter substrate-binding protein DctP [Alphaproteobacteria bacterium]MBU1813039.1 TRAP transporter substrate-binding protein DctP [Alphaproteobacteria bacterium]
MKRLLLTSAMAVTLAIGSYSQAMAERTLRITLQIATNHELGQNVLFFKEQMEKESNGALKLEIYDSAQLYKGNEVPQAVASGAIDMGMVLVDEYAGTIPSAAVFSVAFMFPDYKTLAKAVDPSSPVRKLIDDEILKTGTRVLWYQDYGAVQLLARRGEIRTPADIKGKKVRVLGKPSGDFINALGASPVKVGGSEQFIAYQRGTVDVGMTGTTATKSRKIFEVMDSITITNHAHTEFLIVISELTWKKLSDQEKAWITKAAQAAEMKMRASTEKANIEAEKWLTENTKMKVVNLTPDELALWKKAAEPSVDAFVKDSGETGKKLIEELRKLQ